MIKSLKEILAIINEAEQQFNVDNWVIDNVEVWPLIRLNLAESLSNLLTQEADTYEQLQYNKQSTSHGFFKGSLAYIKQFFNDHSANSSPKQNAQAVFLTNPESSRKLVDGTWYDRHCQPIISHLSDLGCSSNIWCYSHKKSYTYPRAAPSALIQPLVTYCYFKTLLSPWKSRDIEIKLSEYPEYKAWLKSNPMKISAPTAEQLIFSTLFIKEQSKHMTRWLKASNAKLGFVVHYHFETCGAFLLACKQLNIPTIDIQHGVQGEMHSLYGPWLKLPSKGYKLLPDFYWVWGKKEARSIKAWSQNCEKRHQPLIGGNVWNELWKQSNKISKQYDQTIETFKRNNKAKIYILMTLQFGYRLNEYITEILNVIRICPSDWYWILRFHPSMDYEIKPIKMRLKNEQLINVEYELGTKLPLPAWLRHVNVHFTTASSVVAEAAEFGIASVISKPIGAEHFSKQINDGIALFVHSLDEIPTAIQKAALTTQSRRNLELSQDQIDLTREALHFLLRSAHLE